MPGRQVGGQRFQDPPAVGSGLMMAMAGGGLLVNLAGLWNLRGGRRGSLNIRDAIRDTSGVEAVHDPHVWTITSGFVALSCHVVVSGRSRDEVLRDIERTLDERFAVGHTTIQVEAPRYPSPDAPAACDEGGQPPTTHPH